MVVITVARKPLASSVASNTLEHGAGALNIDATRIASGGEHMVKGVVGRASAPAGDERVGASLGWWRPGQAFTPTNHVGGRWPANLIFAHLPGCFETQGVSKCVPGCPVEVINEVARYFKQVRSG